MYPKELPLEKTEYEKYVETELIFIGFTIFWPIDNSVDASDPLCKICLTRNWANIKLNVTQCYRKQVELP